jgi:hypothetical protein
MKYIKFFVALTAIAAAIFTFSVTLYPFFEMGFLTLSEQYPNSKAYIMTVMTDETGLPLNFYIVGMDFTARNIMIFSVPPILSVNGEKINTLYEKKGVEAVKIALGKVLKIRFTDFFIFTPSKGDKFINLLIQKSLKTGAKEPAYEYSEFEENYKIDKVLSMIAEGVPLTMLELYPFFSTYFRSSINISKFLRMINFFEKKPKTYFAAYPVINSNGIMKTDSTKLETLSIELQNCSPFSKVTSLSFTLLNNSSLLSKVFSYITWNKWSQKGFTIRIVPTLSSYSLKGKNMVFEIKTDKWKEESVRKILGNIYPYRSFEFVKLNNFKDLELYYETEEFAALNGYYDIGNCDFIVLIGD